MPSISSTALGLRHRAVLETSRTVFPNTDLPAAAENNIYIFSNISDGTAFLLQGVTSNPNMMTLCSLTTNLKYGKYDTTREKINNNERLRDTAK